MNRNDRAGAIAGVAVYRDGVLRARDCNVTLPELSAVTASINAGGPVDLPITGQFESMESTVTKLGVDADVAALIEPVRQNLEIRSAQDSLVNGEKLVKQIKAFLGAIPKTVPGIGLEFGEVSENEITYTVLRYQLFYDNQEVLLIDKVNGIYRANGRDFGSSVEAYL